MWVFENVGQNLFQYPVENLLESITISNTFTLPCTVTSLNNSTETNGIIEIIDYNSRYLFFRIVVINDELFNDPDNNIWFLLNGEYHLDIPGFRTQLFSVELPILDENKFYY